MLGNTPVKALFEVSIQDKKVDIIGQISLREDGFIIFDGILNNRIANYNQLRNDFPYLYGIIEGAYYFTVFDVSIYEIRMNNFITIKFKASSFLSGMHTNSIEEVKLDNCLINYTWLHEWAGSTYVIDNEDIFDSECQLNLGLQFNEFEEWILDSYSYKLEMSKRVDYNLFLKKDFNISLETRLRIQSKHEATLIDIYQNARSVQQLLTFLTGHYNKITQLSFNKSDPHIEHIYYRIDTINTTEVFDDRKVRYTFNDIKYNFKYLLNNWSRIFNHIHHDSTISYLSSLYNISTTMISFFNAIKAIDSIDLSDDIEYNNKLKLKQSFVNDLRQVCSDNSNPLSKALKEFTGHLKYLDKPGLQFRLKRILKLISENKIDLIIDKKVIESIIVYRNYIVHDISSFTKDELSTLNDFAKVTRKIYFSYLSLKLGIEAHLINKALKALNH
ncbi:MAG: hypothetical protein Kapaf2KO_20770 [Candidatus Kapaibacteriales bacterium]